MKVTVLVIGLLISFGARGQRVDFTYRTFGIENDHDNVIRNAAHLDPFFEKLHQLHVTGEGRVNILHIGDSHLQADFMTSIIRRNFHKHFGNAGRGLIVPLRVAGTNEPNNYKSSSNVQWTSKRCVFPAQPLPIGIGGVTIQTAKSNAELSLFMNDLWLDYGFNSLTLFYEKDENSFDFVVSDEKQRELGRIIATEDSLPDFTRVQWEEQVNAIKLKAIKNNASQSLATIYGCLLENGEDGVLYNTIGVNGAKYKHYNEAKHFANQTSVLAPDLIIISLGTNESLDYPRIDVELHAHIKKLVEELQSRNAEAVFLLVTPQESFKLRTKSNPGVAEVRNKLITYAVESGIAFYDLYRAVGGEGSAKAWRRESLMTTDGVHLTRDGYEYQGNLFYHALMKSFNVYVPARHP